MAVGFGPLTRGTGPNAKARDVCMLVNEERSRHECDQ